MLSDGAPVGSSLRVLVTVQPAWSHLNTIVPLALALQAHGHDVRVASSASVAPALRARGLRPVAAGLDWEASRTEEFFPGFLRARARSQGRLLASLSGKGMVDDLLELAAGWQPQVIVRDSSEFGGLILGALLEVPVAVVGIGLRPHLDWLVQAFEGPLTNVRRRYGLPVDDPVEGMTGALWLSSFPPTFAYAAAEIPHEQYIRPVVPEAAEQELLPAWLEDIGDEAVYVTLGTVFNRNHELLRLVVGSLAAAGLEVVVTTGVNIDPQSLDPLPSTVRVARYVTQSRLSPRVRAVVSHGGFNTVMSALSDGLPVCCLPLAADHPFNASRCVDLGVGTAITTLTPAWGPPIVNAEDVGPAQVVDAVMPLLNDAAYRGRALAVAAELAALPGPEQAAAWIAELAT